LFVCTLSASNKVKSQGRDSLFIVSKEKLKPSFWH
jgi:hypothetical protein